MQMISDRKLIQRYLAGETSAMSRLVQRYHKIFCEKAYWITKDKDLAKDVAQECWITIMDNLDRLDNIGSFKYWAYRIVYTKSIDRIKIRAKQATLLKTESEDSLMIGRDEENMRALQKVLLSAIHQLPREKQEVIRLFYTEEYSIKEIGVFLNIPTGTVKTRLFKAREKLKSIINNTNYEK